MRPILTVTAALAIALAASQPAFAEAPAAVPAAVDAAPAVPRGQLGGAVAPSAYRLDLSVDPAKERFSGTVEIDATVKQPGATVFLHGRDLAMHSATATVAGRTLVGKWAQAEESGTAALTFAEPLPAGPVTFRFAWDAAFNDGPAGLFRVKVGDDWYAWTQLESIDARAVFPSFDEPGIKVPFTVTLRTPPGQTAVSNAPQVSLAQEGGMDVHRFAPTLPLPTYLVAAMVGPFVTVEGEVAPTPQRAKPLPLRIVSTKQNAGKLDFALDGSKGIIAHLENYFGDAFPYPKLDQITTPILPGAMENAGADLYGDSILVMTKDAPVGQKRNFGMVVAHELAHQWFGDLVTPTWWDDIWLNESFANWMGYRIGNEWRPDLNIGAGAIDEGFAAMNLDSLLAGRPIRQKIETNAQIDAAFDAITYGKGGHVVAMIAAFMGDTRFRDGVRRYMAAHRYGNATSADFFRAMAEVSGDPRLLPAMQSFTDQQGVPLLTFAGSGKRITVTQSRYAPLGVTAPDTRWGVPMCLRRGKERACQLLDQPSAAVTIGGSDALVPNAGGTGYYRFELPPREWDKLIGASARLPGGEALALADSLRASFRAGRSNLTRLVALARTMAKNPDSHAMGEALDLLDVPAGANLYDDAAEAKHRRLIGDIARPLLAKYGFDPRAGAYSAEDAERRQTRAQLVEAMAGTARDPQLTQRLADAAKALLAGDKAALDTQWLHLGLAAHLRSGDLSTAKALLERGLASEDPVFRPTAFEVIGASGKEEIARWVLDGIKDERLRPSEWRGMLRGVVTNPATRELGYGWLKANLDRLLSGSGGIFFASRMPQMLAGFCSVAQADEIAREMRPRLAGKTAALELERTIERVRNCGRLHDARHAEVSAEMAKIR